MKKRIGLWVAGTAMYLLLFAWFVSPTPWEYGDVQPLQYDYMQNGGWFRGADGECRWVAFPARTNRVTGEKQLQLSDGEWIPDVIW